MPYEFASKDLFKIQVTVSFPDFKIREGLQQKKMMAEGSSPTMLPPQQPQKPRRTKTQQTKTKEDHDLRSRSSSRSSQSSPASKKSRTETAVSIPTSNSFASLNNNIDVDTVMSDQESVTSARPQKNIKNTSQDNQKVQPIYVVASFTEVKNLLEPLSLTKKPTSQKINSKTYKVTSYSKDDKAKILSQLKSHGLQHHTFSEPSDLDLKIVLKGHHHVKTEELLDTLKAEKVPATRVVFLYDHPENPVFLVFFKKDSMSLNKLKAHHNVIDGLKITWDAYRNTKNRRTQCKNCQRWGHSATNCGHKFRCVKCTGQHGPAECPRNTKDDQVSCVNCGEKGHPSNSRQCAKFKAYEDTIRAQKAAAARRFSNVRHDWSSRQPANHNIVNDAYNFPPLPKTTNVNREYRPVLNSQSSSQPRNNNNNENVFGQFADLQNEFESIPGIRGTLKLYADLIRQLKSNPDPHAQLRVLFNFKLISSP